MNVFDALVVGFTLLAVVMGCRTGLLRSLATIVAYIIAAPVALVVAPKLTAYAPDRGDLLFFVVFAVAGMAIGVLMRNAVSAVAGDHINWPDRAAGGLLGAVRIYLLAVLMVLIFDRIIPQDRQPVWLKQSHLQPMLLAAGQRGVRSLPPGVTDYIDKVKRERGL